VPSLVSCEETCLVCEPQVEWYIWVAFLWPSCTRDFENTVDYRQASSNYHAIKASNYSLTSTSPRIQVFWMWSCAACVVFCDVVKVLLFFETSGHISTASQNRCAKENSRNNYLLKISVKFKFFTQRTHPSSSFGTNELNKSAPITVCTWRHAYNATSFACWLDQHVDSVLTTGTPASMFIYWRIISVTSCAIDKTRL
jgi:hypothetical protein